MNSQKQSLEQMMTEKNFQTTAVKDFETLLQYAITQKGLPISKTNSFFALKTLLTLNTMMTNPIKQDQQRPIQKSFPHLHALNAMLRLSELAHVVKNKNACVLVVDEVAYQSWSRLTYIEKYWNLLSILLIRKFSEALGENSFFSSYNCLTWFVRDHAWLFKSYKDQHDFSYTLPNHYLGFFDLFGLITINRAKPEPGYGWRFTSVKPTPFGSVIANLILKNQSEIIIGCFKIESIVEAQQVFKKIVSSKVPSWKRKFTVSLPKEATGLHIFKVSLCKSWKIIAIDAEEPLSTFADTILDAFEFDHDHLYYFEYADQRGVLKKIYHNCVSESEQIADDYTVGSLNLSIKQSVTFLFDFGDKWEFNLCLEQLNPVGVEIDQPKVLECGGEPVPVQYPSWD